MYKRQVSGGSLPKELLVDYYGQMLYLYSHFNQYTGSEMGTLHAHYAQLERVYKDSLNMVLTPEAVSYTHLGSPDDSAPRHSFFL